MKKFLAMSVLVLSIFILQMPQTQAYTSDDYCGWWETNDKYYQCYTEPYSFKHA